MNAPYITSSRRSSRSSGSGGYLGPWLAPSLLGLGLVLVLAFVPGSSRADTALTFGLYTSKKPTEMVKLYRPLLNLLEEELSGRLKEQVEIHLQVAKTYEEGIQALVDGSFDFSQIGPVSYVQAKEKSAAIEVLAIEGTKGQKVVNGVICVLSNSVVQEIRDLKGKKFAFGDQFSTTGRYNSQLYLVEHGIRGRDLGGFEYLDRHDRVGAAVGAGDFDAGALNERTFRQLVDGGTPLRALALFPIDGRPWVARAGLPAKLREALREALIRVKDPKVLAPLGEEGLVFLPGDDSDYESTRRAVKENHRFSP